MKKNLIACAIIFFLLCLASCGGTSSNSSGNKNNINNIGNEAADSKDSISKSEIANENGSSTNTSESLKLSKEMIVYSCNMEIDVKEFEKAVTEFKQTLNEYDGFVESENYTDNGSRSHYINDDSLMHTYSATVRIPSSKYDNFVSGLDSIGTLRSKTANAENISQEYSDAKATLEIYEAKRDRYIKLLSTITDDEYAVSIEKELTNIEIEINKLKTNMNKMNTDVAYSYVNIQLNEVTEYTTPYSEKSFVQKLQEVAKKSWYYFLHVCQTILFLLIFLLPYIIMIALLIWIVLKLSKRKKTKFAQNNRTKPPYSPNNRTNTMENGTHHATNNMNNHNNNGNDHPSNQPPTA